MQERKDGGVQEREDAETQERKDFKIDKSEGSGMEKEKLAQTLRWKITAEMKLFKGRVLQAEKEEIFALAYRIDCTIRIYEILLECCGRMGEAELESCIGTRGILDFLYERWLKEPDTQEEEMEHSLCSIIKNITEGFGKKHGKQEKQGKAG